MQHGEFVLFVLGIELDSMGDGEARWTMEAGPKHTNPMGTMHGGVLCDLGDAALSTAYMIPSLEGGQAPPHARRRGYIRTDRGKWVAVRLDCEGGLGDSVIEQGAEQDHLCIARKLRQENPEKIEPIQTGIY